MYETGGFHTSPDHRAEVEHLSSLFTWLVELEPRHEKDSSAEKTISKAILVELTSKWLIVSAFANNRLMDSLLHLAQLTEDCFLVSSRSDTAEDVLLVFL